MVTSWTLTTGSTSFAFGSVESGFALHSAPDIGTVSFAAEDFSIVNGDGRLFGKDSVEPAPIGFVFDITAGTETAARELLERAKLAWRGDAVRGTPGATATLTSENGRSTFGRPRRFAADTDAIAHGFVRVSADFLPATDLWFGANQVTQVNLIQAAGGGLISPLGSPLTTTADSDRSRGFVVGGALPTWPVIEVTGPITNPVVEIVGGARFEVRTTLAFDQKLTIDTRPWARTVMRGSASVAGLLSVRSTRLSTAELSPGPHEAALRGVSATGTPKLTLRWRDAYTTF